MPSPPFINALTGLRFWAALMVALFHFTGHADHENGGGGLMVRGTLGVDLFFILSGYILHHVYSRIFAPGVTRRTYGAFLAFRVARLYPVHLFTLGLMLLLYALAVTAFGKIPPDNASYQFPALLQNLLMVHAWFGAGSPNIPAWSISAEWFMYLLYPLLVPALLRLSGRGEWLLAALCLVAAQYVAALHPLAHILPEFILGVALYQLNARYRLAARPGRLGGLWLLALALAAAIAGVESRAAYALLFGLLIVSLASERDYLAGALALPACVYLGEISYSLYMAHSFVWSALKNTLRLAAPAIDLYAWPVSALAVVLSVAAACAVYHLVEIPGRRWIRGMAQAAPRKLLAGG